MEDSERKTVGEIASALRQLLDDHERSGERLRLSENYLDAVRMRLQSVVKQRDEANEKILALKKRLETKDTETEEALQTLVATQKTSLNFVRSTRDDYIKKLQDSEGQVQALQAANKELSDANEALRACVGGVDDIRLQSENRGLKTKLASAEMRITNLLAANSRLERWAHEATDLAKAAIRHEGLELGASELERLKRLETEAYFPRN